MILTGMTIRKPAGAQCVDERREGLTARFGELFRIYLREMGRRNRTARHCRPEFSLPACNGLPPSEWDRLRIVHGFAAVTARGYRLRICR